MRTPWIACAHRRIPALELALATAFAVLSGSGASAQAAGAGVDACSLLSAADVHAFAPGLGAGHPGKTQRANVSTCQWDNAHGIPVLMLEVVPAGASSLKESLEEGMGPMGYSVVDVPDLGDEAAVAVQQANPTYNIQPGVAILTVRVGKQVLQLSPAGLNIQGPGSAGFQAFKKAAATAAKRLKDRAG
ncbi:MAG: hypothetical protein P8Z36_06695 [Gemmatimonadota bacterium]|jgi:hypothetical protein